MCIRDRAVRVAVGDHYGLSKGRSVMGKIVNALHRMGFDEVYDTSFSADLTIMAVSYTHLARNCPAGAISGLIKHPHHIDNTLCIKCGACKDNCNFDAIYVEA